MAIDKRLIFYKGKYVYLKVLDDQDLNESGWVGWFNNEELCMTSQHHSFPNSFRQQKFFLDEICMQKEKIQLGIVDIKSPDFICGVVSLSNIDFKNRTAEIGHILDSNLTKNNPSILLESWMLIIKHGFNQLGLNKIYGGTFNKGVAEVMKHKFGFVTEGMLMRHIYKNSNFQDIILLAVFADSVKYPEL